MTEEDARVGWDWWLAVGAAKRRTPEFSYYSHLHKQSSIFLLVSMLQGKERFVFILNENHYVILKCHGNPLLKKAQNNHRIIFFLKTPPISQRKVHEGHPRKTFPHYYLHNLDKYLQFWAHLLWLCLYECYAKLVFMAGEANTRPPHQADYFLQGFLPHRNPFN